MHIFAFFWRKNSNSLKSYAGLKFTVSFISPPCSPKSDQEIIPFQDRDAMYFLYTDKERKTVEYNLTTKVHKTLPRSQSDRKINKLKSRTRIGKFYWILGQAFEDHNEMIGIIAKSTQTSLWSIKKQRFVNGAPRIADKV